MVSLEELVSLVTRGTPRGDYPHGGRGGGGDGGGGVVVSDTGVGEAKAREVEGAVEESKARREEVGGGGGGGGGGGDRVQERKQEEQKNQEVSAGNTNIGGASPAAAAAAAAPDPEDFSAAAATSGEPPNVLLAGTPPPPSSWFRNRPDDPHGGAGPGRERPLPLEVRWAFMWLLDSVFFSVKEPVEGLDRHPSVHAMLEDLLAVRARARTCSRV